MKICMSVGHGLYVRGASASPRPPYCDEVDECRKVVDRVAEFMRQGGVEVETFFDTTSTSSNQNLNTIVNWHNARQRDLDLSMHMNAYQVTSKAMGTETLYVTQATLAGVVSQKVAQAGSFINRGAKKRTDLFFLNNTSKPALLEEVMFVDSSADCDLYRRNFDAICRAIAEGVTGITIGEPPDIEEPPPEPEVPPPDLETAHVDIAIKATGTVRITINGEDFLIQEPGPEEPSVPVFKSNHQTIICSVFGGSSDPNDSAYAPYDPITDSEISCALPMRVPDPRPLVEVMNEANGKTAICQIRDIGPWLIDDVAYVMGNARPVAEPKGSTIPRGKNQGKTSNGAGLDVTPAAARALGISGMGTVSWRFVEEVPVA